MKYNETSNKDRERVIESYLRGDPIPLIMEFLNLKRTTINSIIKVYRETSRIHKLIRGGSKNCILNEEEKIWVKDLVDQNCSITLHSLKKKVHEMFQKSVSCSTLFNYLKDFHYTLKRISVIPEKRNNLETIELRRQYVNNFARWISDFGSLKIIFVDEFGISVSMRLKRGRSRAGERAFHVVPNIRTRNISVCAAMTSTGLLHFKSSTSAYNTCKFCEFIKELCNKLRNDGVHNTIFIMDNVAFHKSTSVRDIISQNGHEIGFLAPYSPFLNPIENMFSKWKNSIISRNHGNEEELLLALESSSHNITSNDARGYFDHMISYLPRCSAGEEIYDG